MADNVAPAPGSTAWKLQEADRLRLEGNDYFQKEQYARARAKYRRAALYLRAITSDGSMETAYAAQMGREVATASGEEARARDTAVAAVYSNIAACCLKLGEPHPALEAAQEVLKVDASHDKARYRAAQAYLALRNVDKASELVAALLKEDPANRAALALERQIQQENKRQDVAARKTFSKMFR